MGHGLSTSQSILRRAKKLPGTLLFVTRWGRCCGFSRDPPCWLGTETHQERTDNPATRHTRGSQETTQKWSETPEIMSARHRFITRLGLDAPRCPSLPSPQHSTCQHSKKSRQYKKKAISEVLLHSSVPHVWAQGRCWAQHLKTDLSVWHAEPSQKPQAANTQALTRDATGCFN